MSAPAKRMSTSEEKRARLARLLREKSSSNATPAITEVRRGDALPLSFAQQRLWVLDQQQPGTSFYSLPSAVRWRGTLNASALEKSLGEIVRRHEVLRTTFAWQDGQAVQVIAPPRRSPLPSVDLGGLPRERAESELRRLIEEDHRRPFDLARGPLVRFALVRLGAKDHTLIVCLHHIVFDGWSTRVFDRELTALYPAMAEGSSSPLPALPIQYADFALWQRSTLTEDVLETQLAYWTERLGGAPRLNLPTDRPRPTRETFRGGRAWLRLEEFGDRLRDLGRETGATLFMGLLTAFQMALGRFTGQTDVMVGAPVANRQHGEVASLIGFFANTLVLRTDLGGEVSFRELLDRVRRRTLEGLEHQDLPFERLVESLDPKRQDGEHPIFQVTFALQLGPPMLLPQVPGLKGEALIFDEAPCRFDLEVHCWEKDRRENGLREKEGQLTGFLGFKTDLFDVTTIRRLGEQLEWLLRRALEAPDRPLAEISHLSPAARHQIVLEWEPRTASEDFLIDLPREEGTWLRVIDGRGQRVAIGIEGELWADSRSLASESLASESLGTSGRWLADGRLEMRENRRRVRLAGYRVDLASMEASILERPEVEDCRVVLRRTMNGERELVAYAVLTSPLDGPALRPTLRGFLPGGVLPPQVQPVASIPVDAEGRVDEARLLEMGLVDSSIAQGWERRLEALAEVGAAAVLMSDEQGAPAAIHLSELLPAGKLTEELTSTPNNRSSNSTRLGKKPEARPAETAEEARASEVRGADLMVSDGEPVHLAEVLERAARGDQGLVFVRSDGEEVRRGYGDLLDDAQRVCGGLRRLGLEPGQRVIFQLEAAEEFLPAFWGVTLAGGVPVPVSVPPVYTGDHAVVRKLKNAWSLLGEPLILVERGDGRPLRVALEELGAKGAKVASVADLRTAPPAVDTHQPQPNDLALLLLTSGSTGLPKAVGQTHRNLLQRSAATVQMNGFTAADVSLNWFPLDHVGGLVMFHLRDVWLGCRQIQMPTSFVLEDPLRWLSGIERHRATVTWAPNFAFGLLVDRARELRERRFDLSSMRFILNGGEAIVAKTALRFLNLLAPHGLGGDVMYPAWGMSETCSGVVYSHRFSDSTAGREDDLVDDLVEVGAPVPGFELRVVDGADQILPQGRIGRLQGRGTGVTPGYWGNDEVNAAAFTADGWFNTGDLGVIRDDLLTLTGREKDVIIVNGINFYSHEIEAVVEETEGVEVSYTAACAVRPPGSDSDQLILFFHPIDPAEETWPQLIETIRDRVMRQVGVNPEVIVPVGQEDVPKTAIGKIQRAELGSRFTDGKFEDVVRRMDLLMRNEKTVPSWFFRKVWRERQPRGASLLPPGDWLVVLDGQGLGERVVPGLGEMGDAVANVVTVEAVMSGGPVTFFELSEANRYRLDGRKPEHWEHLISELRVSGRDVRKVLHLTTYGVNEGAGSEPPTAFDVAPGALSVLYLTRALGSGGQPSTTGLWVVGSHTQATGPGDTPHWQRASVLGWLKTLGQETPWLRCHHVDLGGSDPAADAAALRRELLEGSDVPEVAWRAVRGGALQGVVLQGDLRRLVPRLERLDLRRRRTRPKAGLRRGGFYLISGGLGGIARGLALYLLRHWRARLLLVGRRPLAALPDGVSALERLQEHGEVSYAALDIGDGVALRRHVEDHGGQSGRPLDGIFHLAGVFDERAAAEEDAEHFAEVLHAKVRGTEALHSLIADRRDALWVGFSSVNGFFGGATVGAYAAANSALDAFCEAERHGGRPSWGLAWSLWDEVGMSRGYLHRELSRSRGFMTIAENQGLASLVAVLDRGPMSTGIGLDGGNPHIRRFVEPTSLVVRHLEGYLETVGQLPSEEALVETTVRDRFGRPCPGRIHLVGEAPGALPRTATGAIDRSALTALVDPRRSASGEAPRGALEKEIAAVWSEVLEVPRVCRDDNFFTLGGHSLLAVRVLATLQVRLGVEIGLDLLFHHPLLADLAVRVAELQKLAPPAATPGRIASRSRRNRRLDPARLDDTES